MFAENGLGRSAAGPIVFATTHEAVPSAAPLVQAELTAQGGIDVHWESLEHAAEQANGQIVAYRVSRAFCILFYGIRMNGTGCFQSNGENDWNSKHC